jgi:hypothetical protein
MKPTIDPLKSPNDPAIFDLELPLHGTYYPLGFSLEIATNSEQVLLAAEESWGHFHKKWAEPPAQLRVTVWDGPSFECVETPTVREHWNLLVRVANAANFSVSNMQLGLSSAWLTPSVVADQGYFRYHLLEAMCWDVLDPLYLTSIHAACLRKNNRGVLLCGDSGAGKSSLAYACAREGWMLLSDDSTCLVRKSAPQIVVGNPFQIRFRSSAVSLFPELRDRKIARRLYGKLSIEMPTAELPEIKTIYESSVDHILFLRRGQSGRPRLVPLAKEIALPWFEKVIWHGETAVREVQRAAFRSLLEREIFELHYDDLDSAVAFLEEMVLGEVAPAEPAHSRQRIHA